jgi:hypothetical protein
MQKECNMRKAANALMVDAQGRPYGSQKLYSISRTQIAQGVFKLLGSPAPTPNKDPCLQNTEIGSHFENLVNNALEIIKKRSLHPICTDLT